jgi:hypothetical protein
MEELELIIDKITKPADKRTKWEAVNQIESAISSLPPMFGELTERGTPGLYSRELFMPKGMLCTSRIHKVEHQFIVSEGCATVYNTLTDKTFLVTAPYHGITLPGTRRVLYIHEDCRWATFHKTDRIKDGFNDLEKHEQQVIFDLVMGDIIQEYYNPLLYDFNEGVFI